MSRTPVFSQAFLTRFWAKVDKSGEVGACWMWTACTNDDGYGQIWYGTGRRYAHRIAYEIANGVSVAGMVVRHTCDVPGCVAADHLEIGTVADNVRDRDARGRRAAPAGTKNPNAKLTESDIPVIRARHAAGESMRALARAYGVNHWAISSIVRRKSWKHA